MLRWFRVHASRIAGLAMISLAGLGGSTLTPHEDDCHDAACSAMAVAHDASAHSIASPRADSSAHPLHCLACHWARSFRPRVETELLSTPVVEAGSLVPVALYTVVASAPVAQPPLRSPPQSPDHA